MSDSQARKPETARPALTITDALLDEGLDLLETCLEETLAAH